SQHGENRRRRECHWFDSWRRLYPIGVLKSRLPRADVPRLACSRMIERNMLYEMHMHTPLCRHARGEPEEYAARAQARGLSGIVVTCHNPFPDQWEQGTRMYLEQWDEYVRIIERARAAWAGRVDVRLG